MRLTAITLTLGAVALTLSGCMGGPTYGTGATQTEQLIDGLASATTIRGPQNPDIEYNPRPALVTPPTTGALPQPQTSVAQSEQWPESPEETRQRLIARADAEGTRPGFRPAVGATTGYSASDDREILGGSAADGPPRPGTTNDARSSERFRQARAIQQGADPTSRNFLSEPPLTYRQPAQSAPVGELGETERTKQRERERLAKREGTGKRRWWPF